MSGAGSAALIRSLGLPHDYNKPHGYNKQYPESWTPAWFDACARAGVSPEDLLERSTDSFKTPGASPKILSIRHAHYEQCRRERLHLVSATFETQCQSDRNHISSQAAAQVDLDCAGKQKRLSGDEVHDMDDVEAASVLAALQVPVALTSEDEERSQKRKRKMLKGGMLKRNEGGGDADEDTKSISPPKIQGSRATPASKEAKWKDCAELHELTKYFHLSEKAAAKELGICLTSLKKLCRCGT
jgi:hypothetical protein